MASRLEPFAFGIAAGIVFFAALHMAVQAGSHHSPRALYRHRHIFRWPHPNVWPGTSVEDQPRAKQRVPASIIIPAAVRFLWVEPIPRPIDLSRCGAPPAERARMST